MAICDKFGNQTRFASKCQIDEATISKFVRGVKVPNKAQKEKMEEVLKTPIDNLLRQGFYFTD